MLIEDGKGKGYKASVNEENMLLTNAIKLDLQEHTNYTEGEAYCIDLDSVVIDGDSYWVFALKNTDDKTMVITAVDIWVASAKDSGYLEAWIGGTFVYAANGTVVTPTNCNAGSGKTATGDFYKNDGSGDMTTLAGQAICGRFLPKATVERWIPPGNWIVPKNGVWALKCDKDNTLRGSIWFFYHKV